MKTATANQTNDSDLAPLNPFITACLPTTEEISDKEISDEAEIIILEEFRAALEARDREESAPEITKFNDAVVLGEESPEFTEILNKPVTLLTGEMWGAKDRRNTQDGHWTPVTLPWLAWIDGGEGTKNTPTWGFSRHPVGKEKSGPCIVFGSSVGKARKAKAMDEMAAMALDIDSGIPLPAMMKRLEELGLFCIVYTSHSHHRSGLKLKRDDVIRKLKIKPSELNKAQVQAYLREHDKNRYEDEFINGIEIINDKKQEKEGVVIELSTPPLDKFRLIFPLEESVKIINLAETHEGALSIWEDKITGLASEFIGVHFDTSCTDPSRLFYTARHPKDADWYCAVVRGKPALLHKSADGRGSPFPRRTYPAASVTGMPSAV